MDKIYSFQILLPNGTSVRITLCNPEDRMPFRDFIDKVEKEYTRTWKQSQGNSLKRKREINWRSGSLVLLDADDVKIRLVNFKSFKPQECHILRLQDGLEDGTTTFENMWDLTPDTDLLKELPEEYTFETALADLIDNSLQGVWPNDREHGRCISVVADETLISIFDNGPGMDGSDQNCIVKWGRMGASLHRSFKSQAIGGKPPYLKPFFGMFGYGGPRASMHLGRRAVVSSKTKDSKKVYTLNLDREALLSGSWKTGGSMRDPEEEEISRAPNGSFTKVTIFEPKSKMNTEQLQCKLKDIYFPYIQYDEDTPLGKTIMPVKFEVNGTDLAEVDGGEIAITNMHSCNGPDFILQLQFSHKQENTRKCKSPDLKNYSKANARLKCVYFPIQQGKENIDRILELLETKENFDTFSRISIRRLGRLLPDARWGLLPFMDLKLKRGTSAELLKRCCMRVKCFIETDAGFKPTTSKTDLAHHNPFTTALRNLGNKPLDENDMKIQVYKDGNHTSLSQLKKEYEDWIIDMHNQNDHDEADCGKDKPVFLVSPANKKALRISSDVARVHKSVTRKGKTWKCGQRIKILKGACAGVHKNNVYATIEHFLLEGLEDESGGEARIICRPSYLPDEKGSTLLVNEENTKLEIGQSLSIPLSVIDAGKCAAVSRTEWEDHIERRRQKSPSIIELLDAEQCQELGVDGELPLDARAGKVPPEEIVAVVRPGNYVYSNSSKSLDQKYIVKSNLEMSMEVSFRSNTNKVKKDRHIYSLRVGPKSLKEIPGLYVFPVKRKLGGLFQCAGIYTFSFHLNESDLRTEKRVRVKPSNKVEKWVFLNDDQPTVYQVRVGSVFPPISVACYDVYDNQILFATTLEVAVKVQTDEGLLFNVEKFSKEYLNQTLTIKDLMMESSELDRLRPTYEATLVVCSDDEKFSVLVPCKVSPGPLQTVKAIHSISKNQVLPGYTVQEFVLEMFDQYGNHVTEGTEVKLKLEGFSFQDRLGTVRLADHNGCIDLGGLLAVTAGYDKNVSISVCSNNAVLLKQQFQTEKRVLRISSKVPAVCVVGAQLENLVFEIVNSDGIVDETIHHDEKSGRLHMLTIKAGSVMEDSLRFTFKHGRCTIPGLSVTEVEESFKFVAAHSLYAELHVTVEVPVMQPEKGRYDHLHIKKEKQDDLPTPWEASPQQFFPRQVENLRAPKAEHQEFQSPSSTGNTFPSPEFSCLSQLTDIQKIMHTHGKEIGELEEKLKILEEEKEETQQELSDLQESIEPYKVEPMNHIASMNHSAAAIICTLFREVSYEEANNQFLGNVIGLVALLGTVRTRSLSKILAEYLGKDQMLAIVCRTFEAASSLEKFVQKPTSREIPSNQSVRVLCDPALFQKPTHGRSFVICLEDIRPYTGGFDRSDPQRRLALPDPVLPNGMTPKGFLGYAVNMVDLDSQHIDIVTLAGYGLRETVLYRLLGELQVYKTREDMVAARDCITHDALSLDGGILKQNGVTSFGVGDVELCFPVAENVETSTPTNAVEFEKQIEEKKTFLGKINKSIALVKKLHVRSMKKFKKTKKSMQNLLEKIQSIQQESRIPVKEGIQLGTDNILSSQEQSTAPMNEGTQVGTKNILSSQEELPSPHPMKQGRRRLVMPSSSDSS